MKTQIITTIKISSKMRNRIAYEIRKLFGRNIHTLYKLQIPDIHDCYIYTEQDQSTIPKEFIKNFTEVIKKGKYYVFGVLEIKKTRQKIHFLADLNNIIYINNQEQMFYPGKDETIIIHVKGKKGEISGKSIYATGPLTEFLGRFRAAFFVL